MPWPKGRPNPAHSARLSERMVGNTYGANLVGERNGRWKGDRAGYTAIHKRLRKLYSHKPCSNCGNEGYVESALDNDSPRVIMDGRGRTYSLHPEDYRPLCAPCHHKYDGGIRYR